MRLALIILLFFPLMACKMKINSSVVLPRNQSLPLFKPHTATFICVVEATKLPPIDAQADAWFLEARALEDPAIYADDRDYKKIVQLTRQAADRRHWKAMLNLASLYLEGRDPAHGVEDAVQMVEEAMKLGIPAAYDRMGTYYWNGTGVRADTTRAYAFWQRAAEMGNPQAMNFLGEKLRAGSDVDGHWGNIPVATKMLECSFGQGYGQAAYWLHYVYLESEFSPHESKARALKVLHEGVKLGCATCAGDLSVEFGSPFNLANMYTPFVDKARGLRYRMLSEALDFNPDRRFPNLDKILPLPPAVIPHWDGKKETLLAIAMGVTPPPADPIPSAASQSSGRKHLESTYRLKATAESSAAAHAPFAGYWRPTAHNQPQHIRAQLEKVPPGLYQRAEAFALFQDAHSDSRQFIPDVIWEYFLTIRHDHGAVAPHAPPALIRDLPRSEPFVSCAAGTVCPTSGVWQPWLPDDHPLRASVNQHWRQAWLSAGQEFPQPTRDWLLALDKRDLTWHLMT